MTIGWPAAIVIVALIFAAVTAYATVLSIRASAEDREAKGKYGTQYKEVADKYEALAAETREVQKAMQADLTAVRISVESIEQMMRDVG